MKHIMNKMFVLALATAMFIPYATLAATTVSFNPASFSVTEGQTFSASVFVNPQGTGNYTLKLEIGYPADLLRVNSFSHTSGWMPLAQPGYDSINNTSGTLIKTAGYPGGVTSNAQFGTVSFTALKSGSGNIRVVSANSFALDNQNNNVISQAQMQAGVSITAVTQPADRGPEPTPPAPEEPTTIEEVADVDVVEEGVVEEETPEESGDEKYSLLAAVGGNTFGSGAGSMPVILIIVITALAFGAYYIIQRRRNG